MGIFFGGLGHGPESSYQISAYYKFFPGFNVFCRISTGLLLVWEVTERPRGQDGKGVGFTTTLIP